jgi:hypothetical protein
MNDFEQGGYNIHEHNHTKWSDERLHEEAVRVAELRDQIHYVGERALQMATRYNNVTFEEQERYRINKGLTAAEAYGEEL